jgi:phage terminase large subunit
MKQQPIVINAGSINLIKEFRNYKNQPDPDHHGKFLNKPIDAFNHAIDAARYGCMMKLHRRTMKMRMAN